MLAEETDPSKLNDLQDSLDKYEIYSEETVKDFFQKYIEKNDRNIIEQIIDASAALFKSSLDLDKQIDFKIKVKSFLRSYSYLSKILDFKQQYWEQLWWFLKLLNQKLIIDDNNG
jgi:type I restriction enzyme, R subunit